MDPLCPKELRSKKIFCSVLKSWTHLVVSATCFYVPLAFQWLKMRWKHELLPVCFCTCMNLIKKIIGLLYQPLHVSPVPPSSPPSNNVDKPKAPGMCVFLHRSLLPRFGRGAEAPCSLWSVRCAAPVGRKRLPSRASPFGGFPQGCPVRARGETPHSSRAPTRNRADRPTAESSAFITPMTCSPKRAAENLQAARHGRFLCFPWKYCWGTWGSFLVQNPDVFT